MFGKILNMQRNHLVKFKVQKYLSAAAKSSSGTQLEQGHIEEVIKLKPTLESVSHDMWHRAHSTFLNHGLATTSFLQIIAGNPGLLTRSPRKIISSLEHWRSVQFGEKLLHILLTKYPMLLNVNDGQMLRTHLTFLKSFACTNKNVWQLLMNCPDLMDQPEETIQEKIDYMQNEMRIEVPEIVKSEALSKKLNHIRYRHEFLVRLGLFKPRPLKVDSDAKNNNHRLYQITDTSEKTFATKVCHVTLEEFECFKELYERELRRKRFALGTDNIEQLDEDDDE